MLRTVFQHLGKRDGRRYIKNIKAGSHFRFCHLDPSQSDPVVADRCKAFSISFKMVDLSFQIVDFSFKIVDSSFKNVEFRFRTVDFNYARIASMTASLPPPKSYTL